MWKLLCYSLVQSTLLAGGQVMLKFALAKMPAFGWTKTFWIGFLLNWQFACSGILFGSASLLWMYILKHFPLSMAYPMISLSYVIGMFSAIIFFKEEVSPVQWMGVVLIMIGCILIVK